MLSELELEGVTVVVAVEEAVEDEVEGGDVLVLFCSGAELELGPV